MKLNLAILTALTVAAGSAFGTVSLNFNGAFDTFVPEGLSDISGTPTNGLTWGIVVDGNNNGLITGIDKYDELINGFVSGQYTLSVNGVATDDVLIIGSVNNLTVDTTESLESDLTTPGGVGGIFDIAGIAYNQTPVGGPGIGVGVNDKFYIVWFDGVVAGTLTDASFILPADGSSFATFTNPFAGVDPSRIAGQAYVGTSGVSGGLNSGISFVPEPSAVLLGGVGALCLLRRRRN